jgi:hypothetical protein
MKKLIRNTAALVFIPLLLTADAQQDWDDDAYVPRRKGIEFAMNIGVYRANHKSAVFYNGTGSYELGDNTARLYEIEERLWASPQIWSQVLNAVGILEEEYRYIEYPYEMRYQLSPMFGFQTLYFFNPESALVLHIDAVSGLKSQGGWNLVASDVDTGQGSENRRQYGIFSKEDRLLGSIGYRTAAYIVDELSWVIEVGGSMLSTRIKENYVRIGDQNYSLLTGQIGPNLSGPTSSLTQTGWGFYGALGVELMFEKGGNVMVTARVSRDDVGLGSYEANLWQGGLYLTWVIPPVPIQFVRAAF